MSSLPLVACVRTSTSTSCVLADRVRLAVGAGELDAFVEAHEMRRRIDVHARTRSLQHGLEVGRDRSLAVGAGDVHDRRQALVRIAELGEQALDPPQRQVNQQRMQQLELGEELRARGHVGPSPIARHDSLPRAVCS